ncbi:flagellar motor protein MotB [Selenomonas ruminantium]|uniref:flagellar motor protein MotB n=1 Tax=Selenomonas ruminantium TaxID=971 RepID=UPI0026ED6750|nr:flagellar motor protein MotB [Selenomonas ruminantium]
MAKKKHAKPHEEENGEAWLLPYSDLMTLLLALFIALFAISQTDQKKMSELAQAFTAAFNMGGPSFFDKAGPNVGRRAELMSDEDLGNQAYFSENMQLEELQKKLEAYIEENNLEDQLSTQLAEEGLMIRIKERALFPSGSAQLVGQAQSIVPVVAGMLASLPERVVISGHTDNVPISTAQYPSNWELSASRAMNLMKAVLAAEKSLNPARFSAIGYSEYRPIADNNTDAGRQQNRRVEIFIARNFRFNPDEPAGGKKVTTPDTGADGMPAAGTGNTPATPSTNGTAASNMATTSF